VTGKKKTPVVLREGSGLQPCGVEEKKRGWGGVVPKRRKVCFLQREKGTEKKKMRSFTRKKEKTPTGLTRKGLDM